MKKNTISKSKNIHESNFDFCIMLNGGSMNLYPYLNCNFPSTNIIGQKLFDESFHIQSMLNNVGLNVNSPSSSILPTSSSLSIEQFANLPKDIRMRILFFLDDLSPLEEVLNIKKHHNTYLQCHAVNTAFTKIASKVKLNSGQNKKLQMQSKAQKRRQDLMAKLCALSDDSLEELLAWYSQQKELNRDKSKANGA